MEQRTAILYVTLVGAVLLVCLFLPRYLVRAAIYEGLSGREVDTASGVDAPRELQLQRSVRSDASTAEKCPNVLVRHDNQLLLFRDSYLIARFSDIDEYVAFAAKQQQDRAASGLPACPVLFLQPEVNAQGKMVYRQEMVTGRLAGRTIAPGPTDWVVPYNAMESDRAGNGSATGALSVGSVLGAAAPPISVDARGITALGASLGASALAGAATPAISDSPMDTNWGGVLYSQQAIDSGKYDHRTVGKPIE